MVRFDSASGSVQSQLRSFFLQFEEKYVTNAVSEESRNIAISVLSQITDLSYSEEFSSLLFLLEVNLIFENAFTLDFGYIQYNAILFDQITENFDLKFADFDFAFFTTIMESLSLSGTVKIKKKKTISRLLYKISTLTWGPQAASIWMQISTFDYKSVFFEALERSHFNLQ